MAASIDVELLRVPKEFIKSIPHCLLPMECSLITLVAVSDETAQDNKPVSASRTCVDQVVTLKNGKVEATLTMPRRNHPLTIPNFMT